MLKIENVETCGWGAAISGMRNPLNSWAQSDTAFWSYPKDGVAHKIGSNDMSLMQRLCRAGTDHRKFMRMIAVYLDITAPLYWWKEFDTYKVGTVANSCSTMHKLADRELTLDDFSREHMNGKSLYILNGTIQYLNGVRDAYRETGDKEYWWQLIQLLPASYNQKRTIMLNYEVLINMYHARKSHKLDEWQDFCAWIETLPYSELITGKEDCV